MKRFYKKIFPSIIFSVVIFTSKAQFPSFGWVKTIRSSTVVDMALDSGNGVIISGVFSKTVDFDNSIDTFNLTSNGSQDIFIAKYTRNGNLIWAKSIGGPPDEYIEAIKLDSKGNIYLVGTFQSTVDFNPGSDVFNVTNVKGANTFILKLDKNANFLWVKTLGGYANTIDIDDNDNVLTGGHFGGVVDFDPGLGVYELTADVFKDDMFVMKLDSLGNFSWAKQLRNLGASVHHEYGLEADISGNVYFAGNFTNSIDFDPGDAVASFTAKGLSDGFILKLNSNGDYQWVKQFASGRSVSILALKVDLKGNILSTGSFTDTVDFDPGPSAFLLSSPASKPSAFLSKLDSDGNFVVAKNFQSGESFGQAIAIDSANNIYISGAYHDTVDVDPGPGIYNLLKGELFNVKLDETGGFVWAAGYHPASVVYFITIYSSILVDDDNSVYFGGSFSGSLDFNPGIDSFPVFAQDIFDGFFLKLGPASCGNAKKSIFDIQSCGTYTLNGVSYNRTGQYFQLLNNAAGCDSIVQLNLKVTKIQTELEQSSCGPFYWHGKILDSSGIYSDTLSLSTGCDSLVVLKLTVNPIPSFSIGKDTAICKGDTIQLSAGNFNSYLWSTGDNNAAIVVTKPDLYWVEVSGENGCLTRDSIRLSASVSCVPCTDPGIIESIYPIPFNQKLTVKIKPSTCELNFDLYNALGQQIIKRSKLQPGINDINTSKLSSGMYFYRIYHANSILAEGKVLKL